MKKTLKTILCLALAVLMLGSVAFADTKAPEVAFDTATIASLAGSISADGSFSVTVPSGAVSGETVLLIVKATGVTAEMDTAKKILDAVGSSVSYDVKESTIKYIDQTNVSGAVTFTGKVSSLTDSLIVLSNQSATTRAIGAIKTFGVTVSGTVTAKEGSNGAASVTVAAGGQTDTATLTNGAGNYSLSSVPTETTTLTASVGDGSKFVTREFTINARGGDVTQNVVLFAKGDVVGDGDGTDVVDVARIYSHAMNKTKLTDPYLLKVANVVIDAEVDVIDVARIYSHAMNKTSLW